MKNPFTVNPSSLEFLLCPPIRLAQADSDRENISWTEEQCRFAAHAIDQHEKLKAELDEWRNMAAVLCGDGGQCHADYGTAATRACIEKLMFDLRDQHEKLVELAQLAYDVIEDDLEERPARHSLGNLSARLRALLKEEKT